MPGRTAMRDDAERPVVVIEFGNEIPARTFDRVLPPELRAHRIVIDPLRFPGLADSVPSLAEQARHWAAEIGSATAPRALLAYCSGAGLGALLAAELGLPETALLVFDPVLPGPGTARELLLDLVKGMDATLDLSEVPDISHLPADGALRAAGSFLRSVVSRTGPDLDDDIADELTTGQRGWLAFTLSAAASRPTPPRLGHVLLSEGSLWAEAGARSVRHTGLSPVDLFSSEAVTPLVEELLSLSRDHPHPGKGTTVQTPFVERDATEALVAAQWSRVLGGPPGAPDTDFFAAGGTSLLAAKLVSALRGALGVPVPLKIVFEAPTFRALSSRIRNGDSSSSDRLLTLNASGRGAPLLLVPAASGGIVDLHRLGGDVTDRPVLGLQARGLDPADGAPFTTLGEMTDDFAAVLEKADVERSLHLAGYCVGGILAYELARELDRRGWDVRSVVLLNTSLYCPELEVADGVREKLGAIADEAGLTVPEGTVPDALSVFRAQTSGTAGTLASDFAQFEARLRVFGSVGRAISGYAPGPAGFPVRLFTTDDRDDPADVERTVHQVTDWPDLGLRDFRQYAVSVDHFEMVAHEPTLAAIENVMRDIDDGR